MEIFLLPFSTFLSKGGTIVAPPQAPVVQFHRTGYIQDSFFFRKLCENPSKNLCRLSVEIIYKYMRLEFSCLYFDLDSTCSEVGNLPHEEPCSAVLSL